MTKRITTVVRGRLIEQALLMHWGRRYEIALDEVPMAVFPTPGSGLRANLYSHAGDGIVSDGDPSQRLRAGERPEDLVRAHPAQ